MFKTFIFSTDLKKMAEPKNKALGFIFITLLLDVMSLGIIIPVFPNLIAGMQHCTLSEASQYSGFLVFTFAAMQFLFSPVLGGLSDRYGRRPVLLFSLFGFGLDYIAQAFAPTIVWLFVTRIIAGITGASFTTASAYIADISPPEKRAQNFGMIGVAFGAGFILGPALGGILGDVGHKLALGLTGTLAPDNALLKAIDTRLPFLAAAFISLMNCLYGYFVVPESLKPENRRKFEWKRANPIGSVKQLKKYPIVLSMVGSIFLIYLAAHAVQSTWSFYTMIKFSWDQKMVGYSLAAVGFAVGAVQGGLIRVIIPKIGQKKSVYIGFILYTIGLILFGFATQTWMMFVFLIPYCLGGITGPALQGIMSNQVPANAQGEVQGGLTGLVSLTNIIGPLLMTSLLSFFTRVGGPLYFPGAPFIMGALLMILATVLVMGALKGKDV